MFFISVSGSGRLRWLKSKYVGILVPVRTPANLLITPGSEKIARSVFG